MMGTPADEPYRIKGEDPVHRVTIAKPFAVGRFTISFDEWDACLADGGCSGIKGDDRDIRPRPPACPWHQFRGGKILSGVAVAQGGPHLPAAQRIRTRVFQPAPARTTPFWFGKTISAQNANYAAIQQLSRRPYGSESKGPKVGRLLSAEQVRSLSGQRQCEEWTEDCYNKRYNRGHAGRRSPWLEGDCTKRMLRGGGWIRHGADTARGLSQRSETAWPATVLVRRWQTPEQ